MGRVHPGDHDPPDRQGRIGHREVQADHGAARVGEQVPERRDADPPGVVHLEPARGRLGLQHHGGKRDGKWTGPPSLVQYKHIYIKELN